MVDNSDQFEREDRELNVVKRARFNQTIEIYQTNEVPEPKFGVEPHTIKQLPALPVRERQQSNMLLHQQLQDNMLDEEVVSFGQRAQQQQDQQQLQLRQHNIPHNPVYPKHKAKQAEWDEAVGDWAEIEWQDDPGEIEEYEEQKANRRGRLRRSLLLHGQHSLHRRRMTDPNPRHQKHVLA